MKTLGSDGTGSMLTHSSFVGRVLSWSRRGIDSLGDFIMQSPGPVPAQSPKNPTALGQSLRTPSPLDLNKVELDQRSVDAFRPPTPSPSASVRHVAVQEREDHANMDQTLRTVEPELCLRDLPTSPQEIPRHSSPDELLTKQPGVSKRCSDSPRLKVKKRAPRRHARTPNRTLDVSSVHANGDIRMSLLSEYANLESPTSESDAVRMNPAAEGEDQQTGDLGIDHTYSTDEDDVKNDDRLSDSHGQHYASDHGDHLDATTVPPLSIPGEHDMIVNIIRMPNEPDPLRYLIPRALSHGLVLPICLHNFRNRPYEGPQPDPHPENLPPEDDYSYIGLYKGLPPDLQPDNMPLEDDHLHARTIGNTLEEGYIASIEWAHLFPPSSTIMPSQRLGRLAACWSPSQTEKIARRLRASGMHSWADGLENPVVEEAAPVPRPRTPPAQVTGSARRLSNEFELPRRPSSAFGRVISSGGSPVAQRATNASPLLIDTLINESERRASDYSPPLLMIEVQDPEEYVSELPSYEAAMDELSPMSRQPSQRGPPGSTHTKNTLGGWSMYSYCESGEDGNHDDPDVLADPGAFDELSPMSRQHSQSVPFGGSTSAAALPDETTETTSAGQSVYPPLDTLGSFSYDDDPNLLSPPENADELSPTSRPPWQWSSGITVTTSSSVSVDAPASTAGASDAAKSTAGPSGQDYGSIKSSSTSSEEYRRRALGYRLSSNGSG